MVAVVGLVSGEIENLWAWDLGTMFGRGMGLL